MPLHLALKERHFGVYRATAHFFFVCGRMRARVLYAFFVFVFFACLCTFLVQCTSTNCANACVCNDVHVLLILLHLVASVRVGCDM